MFKRNNAILKAGSLPKTTCVMGVKVEVIEGESVESALRRLRNKQAFEYKRWTKRRYGYYEKPSELRRKAKKMAELWQVHYGPEAGRSRRDRLHLYIGLRELFARNGPSNAAGR